MKRRAKAMFREVLKNIQRQEGDFADYLRNLAGNLTSFANSMGQNGPAIISVLRQEHIKERIRQGEKLFSAATDDDARAVAINELISDLRDEAEGLIDEQDRATQVLPAPLGIRALLALQEPEEDWLAEGLLPAGGNILCAAYPKSFKTLTALEVAVALATETPVFGRFVVPSRRRTGLVLMEDQAHRVRRRLRRLCLGRGVELAALDGLIHLWFRPPLRLIDDAAMADLGAQAQDLDLDLLIVDSWAYVASGDANDAAEVTPQLARISQLRERQPGLTTWLTHHARKNVGGSTGEQRVTDIVRNSSAFGAWHEACLLLERNSEDSNFAKIRTEFRDIESTGSFGIVVEDEYPAEGDRLRSSGWLRMRAVDGDAGAIRLEQAAERIVPAVKKFLAENPGCNQRQLRGGVPGRNGVIDAALDSLIAAGRATKKKAQGAFSIRLTDKPAEGAS